MRIFLLFLLVLLSFFSLWANGGEEETTTIVFGDLSWNSVKVHNRIMGFIIENGIGGYTAEYTPAATLVTINAMIMGDIDINMESWHSNFQEAYDKGIASGNLIDLGKNMPDAPQGWWVPRYIVEGPDAIAPDLKSVNDLPKYANLFPDPEDPKKGVIYAGVASWAQLKRGKKMFDDFDLHDRFNIGIAGSDAALAASMVGAYKKNDPWVGYYWAPTAVLGRLDMVMLKGSEYPPANVNILISKPMKEKAPDIVEILENYSTTVDTNNEFLAKMDQEEWDAQETALWFLKNREAIWTEWVSMEIEKKVKEALEQI